MYAQSHAIGLDGTHEYDKEESYRAVRRCHGVGQVWSAEERRGVDDQTKFLNILENIFLYPQNCCMTFLVIENCNK